MLSTYTSATSVSIISLLVPAPEIEVRGHSIASITMDGFDAMDVDDVLADLQLQHTAHQNTVTSLKEELDILQQNIPFRPLTTQEDTMFREIEVMRTVVKQFNAELGATTKGKSEGKNKNNSALGQSVPKNVHPSIWTYDDTSKGKGKGKKGKGKGKHFAKNRR